MVCSAVLVCVKGLQILGDSDDALVFSVGPFCLCVGFLSDAKCIIVLSDMKTLDVIVSEEEERDLMLKLIASCLGFKPHHCQNVLIGPLRKYSTCGFIRTHLGEHRTVSIAPPIVTV